MDRYYYIDKQEVAYSYSSILRIYIKRNDNHQLSLFKKKGLTLSLDYTGASSNSFKIIKTIVILVLFGIFIYSFAVWKTEYRERKRQGKREKESGKHWNIPYLDAIKVDAVKVSNAFWKGINDAWKNGFF